MTPSHPHNSLIQQEGSRQSLRKVLSGDFESKESQEAKLRTIPQKTKSSLQNQAAEKPEAGSVESDHGTALDNQTEGQKKFRTSVPSASQDNDLPSNPFRDHAPA